MSKLAWQMIRWFLTDQRGNPIEHWTQGFISSWLLSEILGGRAEDIQAERVHTTPSTRYERALRECVDAGLVQELALHKEHWCLLVEVRSDDEV